MRCSSTAGQDRALSSLCCAHLLGQLGTSWACGHEPSPKFHGRAAYTLIPPCFDSSSCNLSATCLGCFSCGVYYGTNNCEEVECLSETLNHLDFASAVQDLLPRGLTQVCESQGGHMAELSLQVPGHRPCPAERCQPGRAHHQLQRAAHADGQRVPHAPAALRTGSSGSGQSQPEGCHPGRAGRWGQSPLHLWPLLGTSRAETWGRRVGAHMGVRCRQRSFGTGWLQDAPLQHPAGCESLLQRHKCLSRGQEQAGG